ncbi:hypothetical protein JCM16418_4310 [Paenibacillus pini JCM 16418]|uniref:Uncharacterized protein n=1 Tax=Paenibacillus pini JCM 16418 TaxID=1236976 RepID=W7YSF3_9BACL|nr:hypothetical protein JCM16418_4310 [Paenibacillus pini JCM 16418]
MLDFLFNTLQLPAIMLGCKSQRHTVTTSTACTTDTVNIALYIMWNIIVKDVSYAFDIQTTRRYVRSDK